MGCRLNVATILTTTSHLTYQKKVSNFDILFTECLQDRPESSITFHARAVSEIKLATAKTKTHYKITIYHIIADVRKLC
jgi:hypothetical protein